MFHDRRDAGHQLAMLLTRYADRDDVIVLALPRGGVPVAYEIATALRLPLDLFLVRKLGVPDHEELAMGAIASGGVRILSQQIVDDLEVSDEAITETTAKESQELGRRERLYRGDRPLPRVEGKTVILVDDGIATGLTMRAAVRALRNLNPAAIVVAVPVGAAKTCDALRTKADEVVCVYEPVRFQAVSLWYTVFDQTSDAEVQVLLNQNHHAEV